MESVFATKRSGVKLEDCQFYHTMDFPGLGVVEPHDGGWDLRPTLENFIGGIDFKNKRVLEVGPASGFLTFEMERRGADIVCIEIPSDHKTDVVPYPGFQEKWIPAVQQAWRLTTNSWWFAHEQFSSSAKIVYSSAYDIDKLDLGSFDISIMSNMLLHNRDPLKIIQNCMEITSESIVIIDIADMEIEEMRRPIMKFQPEPLPNIERMNWNQWWRLSTDFIKSFCSVFGFYNSEVSFFKPAYKGFSVPSYRVISKR